MWEADLMQARVALLSLNCPYASYVGVSRRVARRMRTQTINIDLVGERFYKARHEL